MYKVSNTSSASRGGSFRAGVAPGLPATESGAYGGAGGGLSASGSRFNARSTGALPTSNPSLSAGRRALPGAAPRFDSSKAAALVRAGAAFQVDGSSIRASGTGGYSFGDKPALTKEDYQAPDNRVWGGSEGLWGGSEGLWKF